MSVEKGRIKKQHISLCVQLTSLPLQATVASFLLLQVPCCCRSPAVAVYLAIDPNVTCVLVV